MANQVQKQSEADLNSLAVEGELAAPSIDTSISEGSALRQTADTLIADQADFDVWTDKLDHAMNSWGGFGTDEDSIKDVLDIVKNLSDEQKAEFLAYYKEHSSEQISLEDDLRGDLSGSLLREALQSIHGYSKVAVDIISSQKYGEIKALFQRSTPEELAALGKEHPETIISLKNAVGIPNEEKAKMVGALDGTREGELAARLYFGALGRDSAPIADILEHISPEDFRILERKFDQMFVTVDSDLKLRPFLSTHLDDNADKNLVDARIEYLKEAVTAVESPEAETKTSGNETDISESSAAIANQPMGEQPELSQAETKVYIHPERLKNRTLAQIVTEYQEARLKEDVIAIAALKERLQNEFSPADRLKMLGEAKFWGHDKKTLEVKPTMNPHNMEFHIDFLRLLDNPVGFNVDSFLVTAEGMDLATYKQEMARYLIKPGETPFSRDIER